MALSEVCGIRDAAELAATLQMLAAAGPVRIDTADLASIDVAILQLLLSATKSRSDGGPRVEISAPSGGTFETAIERAGLSGAFDAVVVRPSAAA